MARQNSAYMPRSGLLDRSDRSTNKLRRLVLGGDTAVGYLVKAKGYLPRSLNFSYRLKISLVILIAV
jgi:hypothetical protein